MITHFKIGLRVITACILLASCSPIVDSRGHTLEAEDLKQIVVGQSRGDDVTALLGTPTARSSYGDETWYYITEKKETVGMFAPEVIEQHVTAIRFTPDHVVADVSEYKKSDGKPVELVNKTTPTEGHELSFMEQMMGNFGKFNAPGKSIDPRDLGH
jgi:outer membrane protein assembly factor BamE (lipoprotein component of BamABCDE complex)